VSACVLARVNAIGKRVEISMRGASLEVAPKVPVETAYRENHGTPIASFKSCGQQCLWGDPLRRNCDWEPRYVGQCVRGPITAEMSGLTPHPNRVALALPAGTHARIRICPGIYGCDDSATGAGPFQPAPYYSGQPIAQGRDTVVFECPLNGPLVGSFTSGDRTGYYSVMIGSAKPGTPLPNGLDVKLASPASTTSPTSDAYPAPEAAVFTYREGAFYGNLFTPPNAAQPATDCPDVAMFSGDQYACFSSMWSDGAAMASDRFCAGPEAHCFGNDPAGCDPGPPPSGRSVPAWLASSPRVGSGVGFPGALPGDVVYDKCEGRAAVPWPYPYTTYLNHPCDLFPSLDACKAYLRADVARSLPPAPPSNHP
jgi:hypothetical protein